MGQENAPSALCWMEAIVAEKNKVIRGFAALGHPAKCVKLPGAVAPKTTLLYPQKMPKMCRWASSNDRIILYF